ncbi:MAG: hypothetical protein ACJAWV_004414 [Flammeovirgaceae bacterium]|jgi:hypothetical protein
MKNLFLCVFVFFLFSCEGNGQFAVTETVLFGSAKLGYDEAIALGFEIQQIDPNRYIPISNEFRHVNNPYLVSHTALVYKDEEIQVNLWFNKSNEPTSKNIEIKHLTLDEAVDLIEEKKFEIVDISSESSTSFKSKSFWETENYILEKAQIRYYLTYLKQTKSVYLDYSY